MTTPCPTHRRGMALVVVVLLMSMTAALAWLMGGQLAGAVRLSRMEQANMAARQLAQDGAAWAGLNVDRIGVEPSALSTEHCAVSGAALTVSKSNDARVQIRAITHGKNSTTVQLTR